MTLCKLCTYIHTFGVRRLAPAGLGTGALSPYSLNYFGGVHLRVVNFFVDDLYSLMSVTLVSFNLAGLSLATTIVELWTNTGREHLC